MSDGAHAAVLLAAGGSRRLGRAKQLLPRDGEPLVRRIGRLLHDTAPLRLCVVTGGRRDAVVDALQGLPFDEVHNLAWARGLGGSVRAAAVALRAHAGPVLVAGCDQPALAGRHLDALLDAARRGGGFAAVAHAGAPGIPVVVPGSWFAACAEGDAASDAGAGRRNDATPPDRGLGAALRALPRGRVALLDLPELAFDLDTDDDVAAAIVRGWLDPAAAQTA